MSIATLHTQDIIRNYESGARITIKHPIIRTCEGNYSFQGRITPLKGRSQEYCITVNSTDFQILCNLHKTTKEGN